MRRAVLFLTLATVLTSCSLVGGHDTSEPPPETSSDALAFTETDATGTVPPAERDRGGELRVGVVGTTWEDPAAIDEALRGEQFLADLLFDGLTAMDDRGQPVPAVASSWSTSADGLVWTFLLDNGAVFSNGAPIGATEVKRSLERVLARGDDSLAGYRLRSIVEISAESSSEITIRLNRPFAPLAELLAAPIFGIVATELDQGLVTSSQQVVIARVGSAEIELSPAPGLEAYVDGLVVRIFQSDRAAAEAYDAGALDIALTDTKTEGVRVAPGVDTSMFLMNLGDPAFADAAVRHAVVLAVDPTFVAAGVDAATTVTGRLLPTDTIGGDQCGSCGYSPDASRSLLKDLPEISLPFIFVDHLDDPESTEMAAALVSDLEYVGFDADLRGHSATAFVAKLSAGELGLFQFGTTGSWLSPDLYLGDMFETSGVDNVASFSDPQVDRLLIQARLETNDELRRSLYLRIEDRILELAVAIPLFQVDREMLVSSRVEGFRPQSLGAFDLGEVWLRLG